MPREEPGRRGQGSLAFLPHLSWQFEQMRQSVVLTSNFAKSVVNLADVVSCISTPLPTSSPHPGIQGSLSATDPHFLKM